MRDGGGKGDKQRPLTVPQEKFDSNWDNIFKKPDKDLADYQEQAAQLWNDSCTSNRSTK